MDGAQKSLRVPDKVVVAAEAEEAASAVIAMAVQRCLMRMIRTPGQVWRRALSAPCCLTMSQALIVPNAVAFHHAIDLHIKNDLVRAVGGNLGVEL